MSREVHVRICEGVGVRFPRATRLLACFQYRTDAEAFLSARTKIFLYVKIVPTFTNAQPSLFYHTAQQEGRAYRCDLFKI